MSEAVKINTIYPVKHLTRRQAIARLRRAGVVGYIAVTEELWDGPQKKELNKRKCSVWISERSIHQRGDTLENAVEEALRRYYEEQSSEEDEQE